MSAQPASAGVWYLPFQEGSVPRRRYQMPSVLKEVNCRRPYWFIRYRMDRLTDANKTTRAETRKMLGYCDEIGKREAERIRNEVLESVNQSDYVIQSQIPFSKLSEVYRRVHLPTLRAESSRRLYESHLRKIEAAFGELRLMDVSTLTIQKWVNELKLAYTTRVKLVGVLHSMFERATAWSYWEQRNPVENVTLGAKNGARDKRIPELAKVKALIAALDPQTSLMVQLGMWTGMRISEVVGLHKRNLDLVAGIVHVAERYYNGVLGPTKREGSNRDLPLGYLVDDLKRWCAGMGQDDLIFRNERGGYVNGNHACERKLKAAAKVLGIDKPGFGWHALRRLHLTHFEQRISAETMAQAGHTSAAMTRVYVQPQMARREEVVRAMQETMFAGATKQ